MENTETPAKTGLPKSVTHYGINMVGVLGALIAIFVLRRYPTAVPNPVWVICVAGLAPIIVLEVFVLRVHRRPSTGLDWDKKPTTDFARVGTKLLGLAVIVGLIALAYFVFPEYGDWYEAFWMSVRRLWAPLVFGTMLYVWYVDGQMIEPCDAYWQLGRVILGRFSDARRADIANLFRGWLVKAFYVPLFIVYSVNQISGVVHFDIAGAAYSNLRLYDFVHESIFALDVLYAAAGYLLAVRLIDGHIRSAEPTMLGWVVTLECYQPFWGKLFSAQYLHYDGVGFETFFADHLSIRWAWAIVILLLEGIYVFATFSFGTRFSNLTHRGILTNGPYRFSKHPAYVAKNLSWWLTTLPFIPYHGGISAIKSSFALAGVSTIYFLRARTEEKHLSRDPTYVKYALWMNEHGLLRFLRRIPGLSYKAPATEPTQ